jgi:predicted transposase YbfD/YdcC
MNLLKHFSDITDYRYAPFVEYPLNEIVFSSFAAILCGYEDYEEIVEFSKHELIWLQKYLPFSHGIASVSTYEVVFRHLDAEEFNCAFAKMMRELSHKTDVIAIDGKGLRGSKTHTGTKGMKNGALYLLNAFAAEAGLFLGQVRVGEKSNEITAVPQLLNLLEVTGMVVTMDAMGTQKAIAELIIDKGGDYALSLKGNQGNLHEDVVLFAQDEAMNASFVSAETQDFGHGRIEKRTCRVSTDIDWLKQRHEFKGLNAVYAIHSQVTVKKSGETIEETRYFITSLPPDPHNLLRITRAHWAIESFHWSLDVTFGEDKSRIRKDSAANNVSLLRKAAYNLLKNVKTEKTKSIKIKQLNALMDKNFRQKLILQ